MKSGLLRLSVMLSVLVGTATLNVVPFNDEVSQLLIAGHAGPGEGPTASLVVQAVLRICKEMGKQCEVGGG